MYKAIPDDVWTCGDSARVLDLSRNSLHEVPSRIGCLTSIQVINCTCYFRCNIFSLVAELVIELHLMYLIILDVCRNCISVEMIYLTSPLIGKESRPWNLLWFLHLTKTSMLPHLASSYILLFDYFSSICCPTLAFNRSFLVYFFWTSLIIEKSSCRYGWIKEIEMNAHADYILSIPLQILNGSVRWKLKNGLGYHILIKFLTFCGW